MHELNTIDEASPVPRSVLTWIRNWWKTDTAEDRFLAAATDPADLERRMRVIDRDLEGPLPLTFNH